MSRDIYLESTPLHEALTKWFDRLRAEGQLHTLGGDRIAVAGALGRVTAEAVIAVISSPFYHSSAMDGYAVRFSDTFGASERSPKRLKIGEHAVYVDTGDPLPDGLNAVIMIEDVNIIRNPQSTVSTEQYIEIISPATPWQHVRIIGEDIVSTELILPENQRIRPVDIGAMGKRATSSVSDRPWTRSTKGGPLCRARFRAYTSARQRRAVTASGRSWPPAVPWTLQGADIILSEALHYSRQTLGEDLSLIFCAARVQG